MSKDPDSGQTRSEPQPSAAPAPDPAEAVTDPNGAPDDDKGLSQRNPEIMQPPKTGTQQAEGG